MKRDLGEVLRSQQIMLGRPEKDLNLGLAQTFEKQVIKTTTWLNGQPHIQVLNVEYAETIQSPSEIASKIAAFLNMDLFQDEMVKAVDGNLYRNKSNKIS